MYDACIPTQQDDNEDNARDRPPCMYVYKGQKQNDDQPTIKRPTTPLQIHHRTLIGGINIRNL